MIVSTLSDEHVKAALAAVDSQTVTDLEKVDMLMEIAMGLQQKPRFVQDLHHAVSLYDRALALCPTHERLLAARIQARKATALNATPLEEPDLIEQARLLLESALGELQREGSKEEVAEAEMNLGLTLQMLAAKGRARISDAIAAYLRALRTFTRETHPTEYAILHNNLATAYLSMPMAEPNAKMREALAVQSFEEALKVVTLIEQPVEYAMLQNNLGNALQYASSSHGVENNLRALAAYDEALKVRNAKDTPLEYANTISNKANALRNLPDDPLQSERGNCGNLRRARQYFEEAKEIFQRFGDTTKVQRTVEVLRDLEQELGSPPDVALTSFTKGGLA
ncbi:MAG: TPR domain-containing protein [Nitrospira sp.]|jgi:tetratricopeptide (TPR) repeat protein|nr:TPR domain-containing protein [Nitrospira sp.]